MDRMLIDLAPVPMFVYKEKVIYANASFLELTGYQYDELLTMNAWDLMGGKFKENFKAAVKKRLANEISKQEYQLCIRTKSNQERWVHLVANSLLWEGENTGFAAFYDITEKKRLEEELIAREKLWTDIFKGHSAVMLLIDPEAGGRIIDANPAAVKFYGYTYKELCKLNISDINLLSASQIQHNMQGAREGESNQFFFEHRLANGSIRNVQVSSVAIKRQDKELLFSIIHDITEHVLQEKQMKEANQLLEQISVLDGLTTIPNRRAFDQHLTYNWEAGKFASLLMIDIDYFKSYNDTYGHLQGDDILRKVANRLAHTMKPYHQFIARYGGEEFAVVMVEPIDIDPLIIAEKLRSGIEALNIPHSGSEISDHLTVSIGICLGISAESIEDLINKADQALYQAKKAGRNRVYLYDESEELEMLA